MGVEVEENDDAKGCLPAQAKATDDVNNLQGEQAFFR